MRHGWAVAEGEAGMLPVFRLLGAEIMKKEKKQLQSRRKAARGDCRTA